MLPDGLDRIAVIRRSLFHAVRLSLGAALLTQVATLATIATAGAGPDEYYPEDCGESTRELVQAYSATGEDETKEIPAERHRRLHVITGTNVRSLRRKYDGLSGLEKIPVEQRSDNPCDLGMVLHVTDPGFDQPTAIEGVPIRYR